MLSLADYVLQPPPTDAGGDDEEDDVPEPTPQPTGTQQTNPIIVPSDSTRRDSLATPFSPGPIETLGVKTPVPRRGPVVPPESKPGSGRHSILGIPPFLLIGGMVALHIVVVGLANK